MHQCDIPSPVLRHSPVLVRRSVHSALTTLLLFSYIHHSRSETHHFMLLCVSAVLSSQRHLSMVHIIIEHNVYAFQSLSPHHTEPVILPPTPSATTTSRPSSVATSPSSSTSIAKKASRSTDARTAEGRNEKRPINREGDSA